MNKKITICDKEYKICTNAFCMFTYKKEFGTGIMEDISKLQDYNIKQTQMEQKCKKEGKSVEETQEILTKIALENYDAIIQVPLQLAYIFIKMANKDFISFEEWTQSIEQINIDEKWISEVTEIAVNSFCGQGTNGATKAIKN